MKLVQEGVKGKKGKTGRTSLSCFRLFSHNMINTKSMEKSADSAALSQGNCSVMEIRVNGLVTDSRSKEGKREAGKQMRGRTDELWRRESFCAN